MPACSPNIMAKMLIACRTRNGRHEYLVHGNRRIVIGVWDAEWGHTVRAVIQPF